MHMKSGESAGSRVRTPSYRPAAKQPAAGYRPAADAVPVITAGGAGQAWQALVEAVGDQLDGRERLWVLEAGAGYSTLFDLPEDAYIVGVGGDSDALERNVRLDERVVAELADYLPGAAGFDLITCWYGLDGVPRAATLLDRFAAWTALGGLVVLALPNLRSPLGLGRYLRGAARLRRGVTPAAVRRRFAARGFAPVFQAYFEDPLQAEGRHRRGISHGRWRATQIAVRVLSLGQLDAARTDYIVVFRRHEYPPNLFSGRPDS